MADNTTEIARIEALLNSGAKKITTDGQTVEVDFEQLNKRLAYLKSTDDAATDATKRPRSAQINLGGAW